MTLKTGLFDESQQIELTDESSVHVMNHDRTKLLFSGSAVSLRQDGERKLVLVKPGPASPAGYDDGVEVALDRFSFHNGGGWEARSNA